MIANINAIWSTCASVTFFIVTLEHNATAKQSAHKDADRRMSVISSSISRPEKLAVYYGPSKCQLVSVFQIVSESETTCRG